MKSPKLMMGGSIHPPGETLLNLRAILGEENRRGRHDARVWPNRRWVLLEVSQELGASCRP